jgi:hypothetical protein
LVGASEEKTVVERRRRRWEDYIKMDLREIGWGGMDWIHLSPIGDQFRDFLKR